MLDILKNSKIYRKDLDGNIEIKLNNNGYVIRTYKPEKGVGMYYYEIKKE